MGIVVTQSVTLYCGPLIPGPVNITKEKACQAFCSLFVHSFLFTRKLFFGGQVLRGLKVEFFLAKWTFQALFGV
jgi:hypothetical protein